MSKATNAHIDTDDWTAPAPITDMSKWEGLVNSQVHREYLTRMAVGRDLRLYITAAAETGVGKTTLAYALALLWDIWGWQAEKATLDPKEYSAKYDIVPPGSALILDEAEQALDKRRSMKQEQVDVGHDFATKRYRQVVGILTLPSRNWMDDRVAEDMADYWIQALETDKGKPKGDARVYRLRNNEHYETNYTDKTETITWPVMDDQAEFRKLERKKARRMEGADRSKYVHRDEVEQIKENYWNKATKMTRYHIVKAMAEFGISQTDISTILTAAENVEGLSQQRVSDYVNSAEFSEVYTV